MRFDRPRCEARSTSHEIRCTQRQGRKATQTQFAFFSALLALVLACGAHAAGRQFFAVYVGSLPTSMEDQTAKQTEPKARL
jgi:hypothetical protein